jgi:hypothetical protein
MVDSRASSNVMPLKVCEKLNFKPEESNIQIIQLDRTQVKVIGEQKNVLIRMSSNPKIHQTIDIIVVDILDNYGMILSRDWSTMLNVYFSTDWSHLWLPYNDRLNQIKIDKERYMKHMVTDLNDPNEPVVFFNSVLGNYYFDTFLGITHLDSLLTRNHTHNMKSFIALISLSPIVT